MFALPLVMDLFSPRKKPGSPGLGRLASFRLRFDQHQREVFPVAVVRPVNTFGRCQPDNLRLSAPDLEADAGVAQSLLVQPTHLGGDLGG